MSVTDISGIAGKVVAITGASAGIGRAAATVLAAGGARVVLGARGSDALEAVAAEVEQAGGEAAWVVTDVRVRTDVEALVALAVERFGRLDVLVGNAGIAPLSTFDALDVDAWDATVDVNLKGVLHGIAAALPVFRAQGAGHFVHTASTAAALATPTMGVYAATKAAVTTLSESLRKEVGGEGIRVSVITPGFVATDFVDGVADDAVRAELAARRDAIAIPPEAIARAMAYAIGEPPAVDVGEIVVRPTVQA
jgi:NADP-dependent 3-hydroxy acid dehydrogenase YdfG